MNRFLKGLTTGAIIGATAGMVMSPQIDRKTKRKIMRTRKNMMNKAEDVFGNLGNWLA